MKARPSRTGCLRVLALCLLTSLPTLAGASAPASSRKTPARKAPAKATFASLLAEAVRLYEDLEYEQALKQLGRAKALAKGPEQEATVALYEGIMRAELGQRDQALAAFRTGLYLQPEAKLPAKVSPKLERDFEEVRQGVLRDLGLAQPPASQPAPPPVSDRPEQPDLTPHVQAPPPPAYLPSAAQAQAQRSLVLPLALLSTSVLAGTAGGVMGLNSRNSIDFAREAEFQTERISRLKRAENQAFAANLLFGTAGAAAAGALVTLMLPSSPDAPAATATPSMGGSP
jgi:tetratricopeptide (TPR) repeat protein